jgi:sulfotransferase
MDKTYHFISGLPRSGSTMLSAILKQNPRFHSSISDPFLGVVRSMIDVTCNAQDVKHEVTDEMRENMARSLFDGYYKHIEKPVCFNTNRGWTYQTPLLSKLFPKSKMLVCVRDIGWVLDSFEVAHRKNPLSWNMFAGGPGGSVYERCDNYMNIYDGMVGHPYAGIKQAITSNEQNMLMIIEYDQFCKDPVGYMKAIYHFIDEEYYEHDFNNVEGKWEKVDAEIGVELHTVKKKVELKERKTIIPPDIWAQYEGYEVWRNLYD